MSRSAATTRACLICGREVSSSGLAWTSHGKAHARRGEAVALYKPSYGWVFPPADKAPDYEAAGFAPEPV